MFEFRGLTARVTGALDNRSNENKGVALNLPGKSALGSNQHSAGEPKKSAFSDLKNTAFGNTPTQSAGKFKSRQPFGVGPFSANASALKSTPAPAAGLGVRSKVRIPAFPALPAAATEVVETPLTAVDVQQSWTKQWLLTDKQLDELVAMRDTSYELDWAECLLPALDAFDAAGQQQQQQLMAPEPMDELELQLPEQELPPLPELSDSLMFDDDDDGNDCDDRVKDGRGQQVARNYCF